MMNLLPVSAILLISNLNLALTYPAFKVPIEKRVRIRIRRDSATDVRKITAELPFGYHPLTAYQPERLDPVFPMTHSWNSALSIQDNTDRAYYGHMKIPILQWGIWDLHGGLTPQSANPTFQFGEMLSPANFLNLSPDEVKTLSHDPTFRERRKNATPIPVNNLPGTGDYAVYNEQPYNPLMCKPPLCNPHVHTFGTGFQLQQGIDYQVPGMLNFPIPADNPLKPSYRFKMNGYPTWGVQPLAFNYGHDVSGINPWTLGYKPLFQNPGNPVAMATLSNPAKPNRVPYVAPPLNERSIFDEDLVDIS